MQNETNAEHAENIKLLEELCAAILLPGSHVRDLGPDKLPMIAYYSEGATGVALPGAVLSIDKPVVKTLIRLAISEKIGGELIRPASLTIEKDESGRGSILIHRENDKPKWPVLFEAIAWYTGLIDGFEKLGYNEERIIDGLWQYVNRDVSFFLAFFKEFYQIESELFQDTIQTVKVSQPLEKMKNYILIGEQLELLFDEAQRADLIKCNITKSGLDLDEDEEDALFGVQTLFSDNDYKPNYEKDGVEALYFTMPQLCQACGVSIRTNKRGRHEFDRKERARIVKAINKLADRRRLLLFEAPDPKKKDYVNRIEVKKPLFTLMKFYSTKTNGKNEKIYGYAITDYKETLSRDIVDYFLLLPRGLNQDIRRIVGRRYTKYHRRFFGYLFTQANEKRRAEHKTNLPADWTIEIGEKLLVDSRLKMTTYLKARQFERINEKLGSMFSAAKELGYVVDIVAGTNKLGERKFTIQLNREKFMTLKNWGLKEAKQLTGKTAESADKR